METDPKEIENIKILIERTRELSIDLAIASERESTKRFEYLNNKAKFKNSLKIQVSKFPYLYRLLLKIKRYLN